MVTVQIQNTHNNVQSKYFSEGIYRYLQSLWFPLSLSKIVDLMYVKWLENGLYLMSDILT